MRRIRLLLLPPAMAFELLLLAVAWVMAITSPRTAQAMRDWVVNHLPGQEWYFGQ